MNDFPKTDLNELKGTLLTAMNAVAPPPERGPEEQEIINSAYPQGDVLGIQAQMEENIQKQKNTSGGTPKPGA